MQPVTKSAIATLFLACASTAGYAGHGHDDPLCIPVDGTVTSSPIECTSIPKEVNDVLCPYGEIGVSPSPYANCLPAGSPDPVCFSISGKGKAKIDGRYSFSRLTATGVASKVTGLPSVIPLAFPPEPDVRSDLTVFTSSAGLTGKVRNLEGTLYTQDTGVITAAGIVGQVLKIVGGAPGSDFEGAKGTIAVAGQEVGGAAFYTGTICVPRK